VKVRPISIAIVPPFLPSKASFPHNIHLLCLAPYDYQQHFERCKCFVKAIWDIKLTSDQVYRTHHRTSKPWHPRWAHTSTTCPSPICYSFWSAPVLHRLSTLHPLRYEPRGRRYQSEADECKRGNFVRENWGRIQRMPGSGWRFYLQSTLQK